MSRESFPGGGEDSREPSGSAFPPVPEDDWDAEAAIDALVAGSDAGEWDLTPDWLAGGEPAPLAVFCDEGLADAMGPGPVLAALVHAAVQDLAALDEDQLVGVIAAIRRIQSRMAWASMTALRELTSRRRDARDQVEFGRTKVSATAADQVSMELRQSWQSVAAQIAYACEVAARLPETFAALAAGLIHPVHVRIIEDETRYLSDKDAARADETLAGAAKTKSYGELRYAARRLALKLDPASAARRKEAARRDAEVRRFREESGNAGMIARELPSAEVLASWQHVEQRALDLRAAGVEGTLQELRVKAYLDLLQERDSRLVPDVPSGLPAAQAAPAGVPHDGSASGGPGGTGGPGHGPVSAPPPASGTGKKTPRLAGPGMDAGVAALITLTVSLDTALGRSAAPGEVAGFGLLDAPDTRDLIAAAARHPRTRWCLTAAPRRHRRRPRLRGRPPPRGPGPEPVHPAHRHPRPLRPRPGRDPLPAQPQTLAPGHRPQHPVHRPGLFPARRLLRPGPHPPGSTAALPVPVISPHRANHNYTLDHSTGRSPLRYGNSSLPNADRHCLRAPGLPDTGTCRAGQSRPGVMGAAAGQRKNARAIRTPAADRACRTPTWSARKPMVGGPARKAR